MQVAKWWLHWLALWVPVNSVSHWPKWSARARISSVVPALTRGRCNEPRGTFTLQTYSTTATLRRRKNGTCWKNHYNRVTDTCIPEEEAFRRLQKHLVKNGKMLKQMANVTSRMSSYIKVVLSGELKQYYEIDPKDKLDHSGLRKRISRIVVPGWEGQYTEKLFSLAMWWKENWNR